MKRILLVSPFPPGMGGVSVSSQRLYDNLLKDGYDVDKYNIRYANEVYNTPVFLSVRFFWIPFYILFKQKYDVIHFHVPGIIRKVYVSFFKVFYKRARIIYTIHGDVKYLLSNNACLRALSKADQLICVQKGDSQRLPEKLSVKSIDNPAFIMPAYINEESISIEILDFVKREDPPMMLFYGSVRLEEGDYYDLYGINDAVQLYKDLKRNHQEVRLLMLISYNTRSTKEIKFVEELRTKFLNDNDVLIIENNRSSIVSLYKYAKVYLRPTKTDGDSLAIRESIAMGCPVVASNNSFRPEQCIIYNDAQEFYSKTYMVLNTKNDNKRVISNNYYDTITRLYNSL